jgi:cytochrome P450
MSSIDPKAKIERSKAFASGYAVSNVLNYEPAIDPLIGKLRDWMSRYADSGEPMELDKFLTYTAFDGVGEILFSKPFGFIDKGQDIENGIATNLALEAIGTPISQFRWAQIMLANPLVTWLGLSPGSMLQWYTLKALAERQANPDARFDLAAHWFRYLAQHPDRTSLRNMQSQATNNVGAGSDTVSCALQSAIYYLLRHPATWRRARDEIEAARHDGRCLSPVVSYADAQQLPYLQACVKEALRINAPVPMGLPRVAGKGGVTIGDRTFPEGTTLSIKPWYALHVRIYGYA